MAMFRQHISIGAIVAVVAVVVIYFYSFTTDPVLLAIIFGLCTLGSILPDVDSDSGLPFYLMFGLMTVGFGGAVLYFTLMGEPANNYVLIGVPLAALAFFWFVVGSIVKHCTHHRGIWHSLPALAIAGTAVYILAQRFGYDAHTSLLFGVAVGAGFLSHLVLDEIYADVDFGGIPFMPKRSLGTALKLFSHSKWVNIFAYALLAVLVYLALTQ